MAAVLLTAAQGQSGSIAGTIADRTGGVLPGATVTLSGGELRRTAVSDGGGRFVFENVPAGTYRLTAKLPGFATALQEKVVVPAGGTTETSLTAGSIFARPDIQPVEADPTDPALSREVYAVIFRSIFSGGLQARLAVQAESIVPPSLIDEDWTGQLTGVPAELRALLATEGDRRSVWHRVESFPAGTRLVTRKEIAEVFVAFGLDGWARLSDRIGASSYQAMTRVFVTGDRLHALVEYRHSCGSLCGEGALAWLSRRTADAGTPWTIRGRGFLWVS